MKKHHSLEKLNNWSKEQASFYKMDIDFTE